MIIKNTKKITTSLLCSFVIFACSKARKDSVEIRVTDFTNDVIVELEPYENRTYAMMNIWIEGTVNDTILIKMNSADNQPILKLSGEIKERWYADYYGSQEQIIIFEPYRATKGDLKIKAKL